VFSKVDMKCVIAGNHPHKDLIAFCEKYPNIELKADLSTDQIHDLIKKAHINVLHTNQNTGIKLKLLNAIYRGKFAVVNPLMVDGSGLESLCVISKNFDAMLTKVQEFRLLDYTPQYFENRKKYLEEHFNNQLAVKELINVTDFSKLNAPYRKADNKILKTLSQLSSVTSYFSL